MAPTVPFCVDVFSDGGQRSRADQAVVTPGAVHLTATDLWFAHPGREVLRGAALRVGVGDRLGVVGENGSGKTTLLRLLIGELAPSAGTIRRHGSVASVGQEMVAAPAATIGTLVEESLAGLRLIAAELDRVSREFDHETGNLADLSAVLARAEHLAVWDADHRVEVALSRLGAPSDPSRRLDTLSVGERYRVRLACRLAERTDILALDEPTNHLDDAGIDFLTAEVLGWRGAVLIVTHDRQLLDDVVTAVLDLDPSVDGRPALYGQPGYLSYRFQKDHALRRWRARHKAEAQRRVVLAEHLDDAYEGLSDAWRPAGGSRPNRRSTHARTHVKAADRLVERLEARAVEVPPPPRELRFPDLPAMEPGWDPDHGVLELRSPAVTGRLDLPGMRLSVPPAGRLLVTGPNGAGKSTLLRALAGTLSLDRGSRAVAPGARIGVVSQEGFGSPFRDAADSGEPDEPADRGSAMQGGTAGAGRHTPGDAATGFEAYAREALRLLKQDRLDPTHVVPIAFLGLLSEEDLERPLRELSVGQRRRFDLACALLAAPHVLLLDEPTNHLSIDLVDEVTLALRVTSSAVVVATHDRRMRADLADWPELRLDGGRVR
jgi:macrolide transport system ATP-binding/permease protein